MPGRWLREIQSSMLLSMSTLTTVANSSTYSARFSIMKSQPKSKLIVRGTARAEFHSGIYDELDAQVEGTGVSIECLGGGKIDHNAAEKSITVFGLSQGYGKADHTQTVEILRKKFQDYGCITCKD